jgi:hypothetical protein
VALLRENPLLINKIIAERLSDKLQIMMVPSDAKIFLNDVMKGGITPQTMSDMQPGFAQPQSQTQAQAQMQAEAEQNDDDPPKNNGNDAEEPRSIPRRNFPRR